MVNLDWHSFSLIDLENLATPKIIERGREYCNEGHLIHPCKFENVLAGTLQGTNGSYKTRLWIHDGDILWECSCPFPEFCKHLAALAIAWAERRTDFIDLKPLVDDILNDTSKLQNTCRELIARDPVNMTALVLSEGSGVYESMTVQPGFITSRGIINLIRNIFRPIRLTPADIDILSERIRRVENLVIGLLDRGEPDALNPLGELLNSLAITFKEYQSELLVESFKHLLDTVKKTPLNFDPDQVRSFLETLLEIYFDSGLWELSIHLREVLSKYLECKISFLEGFLDAKSDNEEDIITLIAVYEILDIASKDIIFVVGQYQKVTHKLCATLKGYLWLIDRLMDSDRETAYKLAKKGIRGGFESVSPFRERLITIHLKRDEFKQAAALSFIQFKEEPNFDEYLRLKTILDKNQSDFKAYLKQIQELLINTGREKLFLAIIIDQQDRESIINNLPQITSESALLLETAALLSKNALEQFKEIYPVIIQAFFDDESLANGKEVGALLLAYKKICFKTDDKKAWEIFREGLFQRHKAGLNLSKKIVTIIQ